MIPDTKPPPIFPRGNDFSTEHEENGGTFVSPSPQVNLSKKSQQKNILRTFYRLLLPPPIVTSPAQCLSTRACPWGLPPPMKRQQIQMVMVFTPSVITVTIHLSAEPPSYQSLFQRISLQLSEAHSQSRSRSRCVRMSLLFISLLLLLFVVILAISVILVLPISMVTIGSIHLHDCPVQPNIPIFLIMAGDGNIYVYFT